MTPRIRVDEGRIGEFAARWRLAELALVGSVLRDDFRPHASDVDVLVEFRAGVDPSFTDLLDMAEELEAIFGRPVDLVTKRSLKPRVRDVVVPETLVIYAA